jgi:integrase/recombinase XerD
VRIERAIDAFLDWRQIERDATRRSIDSYRRILDKLAEDYPEIDVREIATADLRNFLYRWRDRSASTRANVISVLHSFFAWMETEDIVDVDPSRKIRRPPTRKPDIYRPSLDELVAVRAAAGRFDRPAILLMEGAGLRRSELLNLRWQDIDLVRSRVRAKRKGDHWQWVVLAIDVVYELRRSFTEIAPDPDDHVVTVEVEQWVSAYERQRRRKDPKQPVSEQALMRMLWRVCARAGVRRLSPHQLRHGFANRLLRESGQNLAVVQAVMGHSSPDTTLQYTDEIALDDQAKVVNLAAASRYAQASPDWATLAATGTDGPSGPEWRRRESNPRPQPHRTERLQA